MTAHELLTRALRPGDPGPPLPPGPRDGGWLGVGAEPVTVPPDWDALLDALWRPTGFHVTADGQPTTIARRPVPSAGGTYGVRTHLVIPAHARGTLAPGRYVHLREDSLLVRRTDGPPPPDGEHASVVFTAAPGRAFGRYRHRAWPLWIADTAYAVATLERLVVTGTATLGSPATCTIAALAPASDTAWWARSGAPELTLAHITLPNGPQPDTAAAQHFSRRRSPSHARFIARDESNDPTSRAVAAASQQQWVAHAATTALWTVPGHFGAHDVWCTHLAAARLAASAVLAGLQVRAVSGMTSTAPPYPLHALAFLDLPEGGLSWS
ncbi:hypothetical protein [Rhodococcus rhodnii]|nr:hypothetical protein [Rhodococcus rhodnii]